MQEPESAALGAKLQQALALHQQGKLADAEQGYREVLRQQPQQFDALYLLGVIALQTRRPEPASELFGKAIALRPEFVEAYNNRGAALADLGRLEDALADYDKAIALQADHSGAHNNRGAAMARLGRFAEALSSYDRAIALRPKFSRRLREPGCRVGETGASVRSIAVLRHSHCVAFRPCPGFLQPR